MAEHEWSTGILGHLRVKEALLRAGIEFATPEHDHGIDLLAFRWSKKRGDYVARPLQIKTAGDDAFSVQRKYERIPRLVMVHVNRVRGDDLAVFALTYEEAVRIARTMRWTKTASWRNGAWRAGKPSKKLRAMLEQYRMAPGDWGRFFEP